MNGRKSYPEKYDLQDYKSCKKLLIKAHDEVNSHKYIFNLQHVVFTWP